MNELTVYFVIKAKVNIDPDKKVGELDPVSPADIADYLGQHSDYKVEYQDNRLEIKDTELVAVETGCPV